jgi:hypothetical protein
MAALSDALKSFIAEHIHSVEQVEILLLLVRVPERAWNPRAVSDEIRTDPESAADRLEDLHTRGLVSRQQSSPVGYHYAPRTEELAARVAELAVAYSERRYTVIDLIFAKPSDRIRIFADAFRLRNGRGE